MIIHRVTDATDTIIISLLQTGLSDITDETIVKNYHPDYFYTNSNLFYLLSHGRYTNGAYFVLEENGKYVASAGWNPYEYEDGVAILLSRAYVNPKWRTRYPMGEYLLPLMINESSKYSRRWIVCNEHNIAIYKYFERVANGDSPTLFGPWPDVYKKFKPLGKQEVYFTQQWVAELSDD